MTRLNWNQWKKEYKNQRWNQYQVDVMERLKKTTDNIMVKARAGTGKTTLIYGLVATAPSSKVITESGNPVDDGMIFQMEKSKREPYKITILAFNRHIADEIKNSGKVPKRATVNTAHGMAYGILMKQFGGQLIVDDDNSIINQIARQILMETAQKRSDYDFLKEKLKQANDEGDIDRATAIEEELAGKYPVKPPYLGGKSMETDFKKLVMKLVGYCQKTLTDADNEEAILAMDEHFGISEKFEPYYDEDDNLVGGLTEEAIWYAISSIPVVLSAIERIAEEENRVSFDTMLWLIWKWNIRPPKRDLLIVDEAQDANPAQLNLYQKFVKRGARIVCVGDPAQAIQGFAGADHEAWEKLASGFDAVEMPLAQCFRCDRAIVKLAQTIIPDIQAFKDNGEIAVLDKKKVIESLQVGDTLISRKNSPLMGFCLKAIKAGFSAKIRGRDVGSEIANIAGRYTTKQNGHKIFDMTACQAGEMERHAELKADLKFTTAEQVLDKLDCIKFCWQEWGNIEIKRFKQKIMSLFDDEGKPQITFATIHRSKGDEADRIFILGSNWLPFYHPNMKGWQKQQERNLQYVAITRAKHSLFLVPISPKAEVEKTALEHPYGGMTIPEGDRAKEKTGNNPNKITQFV